MAAVDKGAMDTSGNGLGEISDRLGVGRVLERENHDPVLPGGRILPGEHPVLAVLRGHDVVDGTRVDDDRVGDHRSSRIAHVYRVDPVTDGAQVAMPTIGVEPELRRLELDGETTDERRRTARVAGAYLDDRLR